MLASPLNVLAIDTATERCSVGLRRGARFVQRAVETARAHGDLVLPMVAEVLAEAELSLRDLDGIAYGRGPGAFTGVRIAIGVVQGLAYGANLMTVGISNLAAVAQQVAQPATRVLVCMDARMGEVYWAVFSASSDATVSLDSIEQVGRPELVSAQNITVLAGTGFRAYPELRARFPDARVHQDVLPHAREIAVLGELDLSAGRGVPAAQAQPVYLRDQVAAVKRV